MALTLLFWLAIVRAPEPAANANVDPSWGAVQAFILSGKAQCGVDTVFTLGPLGWFNNPTFTSELFPLHLAWEIAFKLIVAAFFAAVLVRSVRGFDLALACSAVVCAGANPDGLALAALFTNVVWIAARFDRPIVLSLLAFMPSAALALVKFPYAIAFGAAALLLALVGSIHGVRRAIGFLVGAVGSFVLLWSAVSQSPANLPAWIQSSIEISRGYGAALAVGTPWPLALVAVALSTTLFAAVLLAWRAEPTKTRALWALFFGFLTWLALKNGFVRGSHKSLAAFDFVAVGLFALPLVGFDSARRARRLRRVAVILALCGHAVALAPGWSAPRAILSEIADRIGANASFLATPLATKEALLDDLEAKRADLALPAIRALVGRDAVDVFGNAQGVAFLNDLNFTPRPVFQSYAAYTPALQERNRRFLSSERAPRWILFAAPGLDGHLPTIEDATAFTLLSRYYRLAMKERAFLLLERVATSERRADVGSRVVSRTARFGEPLVFADLLSPRSADARALTLRLDLRPSFLGASCAALVKGPQVQIEIEDARGRKSLHSIAPGYVASGFLVSPLLDAPERFESWFHGNLDLMTRSARVLVADADRWAFEDAFRFELRREDWIAPPFEPDYEERRLAALSRPAPDRIETRAGHEFAALRGSTAVLVVGTPSALHYELEPGRYAVSAFCGQHPRLVDSRANGGARFRIVLDAQGEKRDIVNLETAPAAAPRARRIVGEFETAVRGTLYLTVERAEPAGPEAANAFWTHISLERRP